jgi:hypothetical protein
MPTTNAFESRPGVCMSLRRSGDVYEVAIDAVRLRQANMWEHERNLQFIVLSPEELDGRISQERCTKLGLFLIDLLWSLARRQERTSE